MIIHTVRNPFMCREGQFEDGKQSLCIGLDVHALQHEEHFRCYLGKNKKAYYEIDSAEALRIASEHSSIWTNPRGKKVAIIPLSSFERKELKKQKTENIEVISEEQTTIF